MLKGLNFDTPNNACLSLRMIAEGIRRGDIKMHEGRQIYSPGNLCLTLDLSEAGALAEGKNDHR